MLLGRSEDAGCDEHPVEGLGVLPEERAEVSHGSAEAARVQVLLRSERRAPQKRADVLERRSIARELDRALAAVERPLTRDRADTRLEDGLSPAERAGSDRAVTGARLAPSAQAIDVLSAVDTSAPAGARGAADEATAGIGVEGLALHAEQPRGLVGGDPFATLIDEPGRLIPESMMPL